MEASNPSTAAQGGKKKNRNRNKNKKQEEVIDLGSLPPPVDTKPVSAAQKTRPPPKAKKPVFDLEEEFKTAKGPSAAAAAAP